MLTDLFADLEPTAPAAPAPTPAPAVQPITASNPPAPLAETPPADVAGEPEREPPADDIETRLERAAILEHDGGLPRDEADRAALLVAPHPCPPLPRSFRWRDSSPLAELDTDPDDTRIRCAYCRHWKTTQRHGRLLPWCSIKNDWEEPSTLHHCTAERFEFDPAHHWRRWLLPDDGGAGGNGHG